MRYEKKQYIITFLIGKCCIILRSKNRLHHLCAAAIAIFSYLLSGDECKAVIKTLESKSREYPKVCVNLQTDVR